MQNHSSLADDDDDSKIFFLGFFCVLTLVRLIEFNFFNAFFSGVAVITAKRRFFEEHFDCLGAALRNLLKNERNLLRKTMREIY